MIIGTFQTKDENTLYKVIESAFKSHIYSFDTAPSYQTEELLGSIILQLAEKYSIYRGKIQINDKIDDGQMYESKGHIRKYVEEALIKMKIDYIDTLFIHWPFERYLYETWDCVNNLKKEGIIKKAGLCNVRVRHLRKIIEATNMKPDVIQIERHPLRTCNEEVKFCKENTIDIQAYSPLCRMHDDLKNSKVLNDIANKYTKSIAQIILRWHVDTGVTPVFMTTKPERIIENSDIFNFFLNKDDITAINSLDINFKLFLESYCCPGF